MSPWTIKSRGSFFCPKVSSSEMVHLLHLQSWQFWAEVRVPIAPDEDNQIDAFFRSGQSAALYFFSQKFYNPNGPSPFEPVSSGLLRKYSRSGAFLRHLVRRRDQLRSSSIPAKMAAFHKSQLVSQCNGLSS